MYMQISWSELEIADVEYDPNGEPRSVTVALPDDYRAGPWVSLRTTPKATTVEDAGRIRRKRGNWLHLTFGRWGA